MKINVKARPCFFPQNDDFGLGTWQDHLPLYNRHINKLKYFDFVELVIIQIRYYHMTLRQGEI